jgi:DNA-binding protein H-NS
MALKTMSIDKLVKLKDQVEAVLAAKVTDQRRALEAELSKLGGFRGGTGRPRSVFGRRGTVAPKYRNPANAAETWAGRGLKPRWLVAAIKEGNKLEDFAIAAPTTKAAKRGKTRTARKGAKK